MRSRGLLSLIGLFVALVLLGACSSGSGSKSLNTTNSSTKSSADLGGSSGGGDATGGVSTGSVATGGSDTGKQFSGNSDSDFCNDFRHYDSYFSDHSGDEDTESKVIDAYKALKDDAPSELKDDLNTIISFAEKLQSVGSDDESLYSSSLAQQAEKASEEVEQYVTQVCGVDLS